jgi:N-methylhydantoinase A
LIKVPSSQPHREVAVFDGLRRHAKSLGITLERLLEDTELFVHGTTVATNTVIERDGPTVGLIATAGHRDVLALRDGFKPDRYNLRMDPFDPFVPRRLRQTVSERIRWDGSIVRPLDVDDLRRAVDALIAYGAETIGVALLWSVRNPSHELEIRDHLEKWLPDIPVLLSHEVRSELGEWYRTSATVLSAYIRPVLAAYLHKLEDQLRTCGYRQRLLVMQLNGGTASVAEIERRPVQALASGPAAGPAAALHIGRQFSASDLITVDMGGTSFDVTMLVDGTPGVSSDFQVDGHPVGVPALDVHSIGAGGGSVAFVDTGGALRVGPRSAGSSPGPACYQRGGAEPTVSDADLLLGFLDEGNPLGGSLTLSKARALEAIESKIATPLGITPIKAALAIFAIVNQNMAHAIKGLSVHRGIDPRGFALVVGGGAGPIHGTTLAQMLGISRVIIPREAGVFCALGMVRANVRHDYVRALPQRSEVLDAELITAAFRDMEEEAVTDLVAEGFSLDDIILTRSVDALYRNQVKEINVPVSSGDLNLEEIAAICSRFHDAHERRYTYAILEAPIDFRHWRVTAYGRVARAEHRDDAGGDADASSALKELRDVYFGPEESETAASVYDAERLANGAVVEGPAIVERTSTTVVVAPEQRLVVAAGGAFLIDVQPRDETVVSTREVAERTKTT